MAALIGYSPMIEIPKISVLILHYRAINWSVWNDLNALAISNLETIRVYKTLPLP